MSAETSARRPYNAPRRKMKAEETRRRVLNAARVRFAESGITETTIAAVAQEAQVSPQTVYAVFGSKAALLIALLDDLEQSVDSAAYSRSIEATDDPLGQLRLIVAFHCDLFEQGLDVIELAQRSSSDPTVRRFVDEGHRRRRAACAGWVAGWQARGALRRDIDSETAVDLLWVHCGPDLYSSFVLGCGWDRARVERWLVDTLQALLLAAN